jgi:hypothetical protein
MFVSAPCSIFGCRIAFTGVESSREVTATPAAAYKEKAMKRALVVGSEIQGLSGVEPDTLRVAEMLAKQGFNVIDRRTKERATRAGILEGYDALIKDSKEGDAAVVYYSGHGFYARLAEQGLRSWQCIAPTDFEDSSDADWRGITAWELSIKQEQLTKATRNVTVILDCCNSSLMSRDAAAQHAVARALPRPRTDGFARHLAMLRQVYGEDANATFGRASGNPNAVRLVACGETESSYEAHDPRTGRMQGVFTAALLEILEEVGETPISWAAIADAIRTRVLRRFPMQRPEVEGPQHRLLFSLAEQDGKAHVPVRVWRDGFQLSAGRLTGVTLGDVYGVMPLGATRYESASELAQLEVIEVQPLTSVARRRQGAREFPIDAVAFPIVRNAVRRAVKLEAPVAQRERLSRDISAAPTLRVAAADEAGVVAILRLADDALTIEDAAGPLFPAARFPEELPGTLKNLANLGVAQGIRELLGEHGVYAREVGIELGVVEGGDLRPLEEHGASLGLGDRLYVKVESRARQRRLYVHVFNVGVRSTVSLLSDATPAGAFIDRGDEPFVLGQSPDGSFVGQPLLWPQALPKTFPRVDEIIVIVTTTKTNLTGLITREFLGNHRPAGGTKLSDLLAQLQDGLTRDVGGGDPIEGYYAKRLSFQLHPLSSALGGKAPVADEMGEVAAPGTT